jgi:hypothetical protein
VPRKRLRGLGEVGRDAMPDERRRLQSRNLSKLSRWKFPPDWNKQMLIVLSPAKKLDFLTPPTLAEHSQPRFLDQSQLLIDELRPLSPSELASLMKISDQLAVLNSTRYAEWAPPFTPENAKQAALAFNGDVYDGLDAPSLSPADLRFAQTHLRILSGLYGLLRPLDLMQPYRLEMGTRLANARGRDLYAFWGERITEAIRSSIAEADAEGAGQSGLGGVLQVAAAEETAGAGAAAGLRGLERRQIPRHQLLRQAGARPDGTLRDRQSPDRRRRPEGLCGRRLRLCRPGLERQRLGLPAPAGRLRKLAQHRYFCSPQVGHRAPILQRRNAVEQRIASEIPELEKLKAISRDRGTDKRQPSSPRKRGSTVRPDVGQSLDWIPACAGMTELLDGLGWQSMEFA